MLATTILKDLLIVIFFLLPIDTLQSVKECLINWHKMFTLEIELLMFVCLAILIIANIIDLHKVEPSFYFIKYGMPILELTVVLNTTIIVLSIRR